MKSQVVGNVLIVEKDGVVYLNSFVVQTTYKELVDLITSIQATAYRNGYEIGKEVARKNR